MTVQKSERRGVGSRRGCGGGRREVQPEQDAARVQLPSLTKKGKAHRKSEVRKGMPMWSMALLHSDRPARVPASTWQK